MIKKNDVVQLNENHKWTGCIGIVNDIKKCGDDIIYMIGFPIPHKGTAYIRVMESDNAIEVIGQAIFVEGADDERY